MKRILERSWLIPGGSLLISDLIQLYCMKKDNLRKYLILIGLILVGALVLLPVFLDIIPLGHDFRFHMHRISGMASALAEGQLPVRLQPGWYQNYGYPLGIFYGDLFLYPFAILHQAGIPLHVCYRALLVCIIIGMVVTSFWSFRHIAEDSLTGFLTCLLYTTSMWFLTDIYVRSAIGEAIALVFLPLLVLGVTECLRSHLRKGVLCMIVALTGIIQSHVITSVLSVTGLLVFFAGWFLFRRQYCDAEMRKKTVSAALMTLAGTGCMNAGFLVPFIDYNLRHDIRADHGELKALIAGADVSEWFLLDYSAYGTLREYQGIGIMPMTVGLALFAVLTVGIVLTVCSMINKYYTSVLSNSILIVITVILLFLTSSTLPTDIFRYKHPVLYNVLYGWLQFPFRYNIIITLLLCLLFLKIRKMPFRPFNFRTDCMVVGCIVFLSLFECVYLFHMFPQGKTLTIEQTAEDIGPNDDDLYLFYDLDKEFVSDDNPRMFGATVEDFSRSGFTFVLQGVTAQQSGAYIELPIWLYHGYHAHDSRGNQIPLSEGMVHRVRIELPEGFRDNLIVTFQEPWYWRMAEALSIIAAVVVVFNIYRASKATKRDSAFS